MANPILVPDLRQMLAEQDETGLREFVTLHPASVGEFSEGLTVDETWQVLSRAPLAVQAEVFAYYPLPKQIEMNKGVGRERMGRLIEAMAPDDRVDLLGRLGPEIVDSILPLMAQAERHDIRTLLSYPAASAGAIMTTDYASIPAGVTAEQAITLLRRQAPDRETIYYVYVLDDQRHLLGMVSLRELILARPSTPVADLLNRQIISARVDDDREKVADTMARYNFLAIPVVDPEEHLVGIITHDDVIDVMVEEATEDVHRMGAVGPLPESYLDTPFTVVWRKRAVWLSLLFVAELFTFTALAMYHQAIEAVVVLSFFVPLCISTGGNSGSQAATLITRAMALGQIALADWRKVLFHELAMGVALGLSLGAIAFVRASFTPHDLLGEIKWLDLSVVVALAVCGICLWGTLVGSLLPLVFRRLGFDPGYASSPFVATFVDVTGIVIFFSIARVWLHL